MILAEFVRRDDAYLEIRVTGHAAWAEHGEDLVCAAVSVLVLTLANSLEELAEDQFDIRIRSGDFALKRRGDLSEAARVAMRCFEIGMEGLERTYPDNVRIHRRLT